MTFRERCALAAMREIIRAGSAEARVTNSDGRQVIQWSIPGEGDVARSAFAVADAMEAERAKRTEAEAPKDPTFTVEHLNGAVAAARREGRDAGLREAMATGVCAMGRSCGMLARLRDMESTNGTPAPDLAALQAENAKLRAVAEAAARLQLWREDDRGSDDEGEVASRALAAALDAALPGWRTK